MNITIYILHSFNLDDLHTVVIGIVLGQSILASGKLLLRFQPHHNVVIGIFLSVN